MYKADIRAKGRRRRRQQQWCPAAVCGRLSSRHGLSRINSSLTYNEMAFYHHNSKVKHRKPCRPLQSAPMLGKLQKSQLVVFALVVRKLYQSTCSRSRELRSGHFFIFFYSNSAALNRLQPGKRSPADRKQEVCFLSQPCNQTLWSCTCLYCPSAPPAGTHQSP